MTAADIIEFALAMGVAALAGAAFAATFYFGIKALAETIVDAWRWARAHTELRRREREETIQEAWKEWTR